jgi:ribosomal protein L15E
MTAMWAVVIFGVWSAADYLRKFWRKVDDSIKLRRRNELLLMEREQRRLERVERLGRKAKARKAINESLRRPG